MSIGQSWPGVIILTLPMVSDTNSNRRTRPWKKQAFMLQTVGRGMSFGMGIP